MDVIKTLLGKGKRAKRKAKKKTKKKATRRKKAKKKKAKKAKKTKAHHRKVHGLNFYKSTRQVGKPKSVERDKLWKAAKAGKRYPSWCVEKCRKYCGDNMNCIVSCLKQLEGKATRVIKRKGKKVKVKCRPYYEYRANRSDVGEYL